MSHKLRTPLNAIIGFSEILSRQMFGPLPGRYRGYVADIHASGQHLLSIISDILDMAKIEAGKLELSDKTELSLEAVCSDAARIVRERAVSARLRFEITVASDLPCLKADARALRQILLNLLSNAIKFTKAGGWVTFFANRASDGRLAVGVRDSGIGIAPEDLPTALTPFGQISNELSRRYEGTGLGLPLVKSLTELHGGEFLIDSVPGLGTTATILFPLARLGRQSATDEGPTAARA